MKIDKDQIAETFIAGKTEDGRNIVYVATHGGLHAFFAKDKEGNISAIGAAPHKAISRFLAEKKEKGIKWGEEFKKSESLEKSKISKEKLYHVTPVKNLKNIMKEGLIPQVGPRSEKLSEKPSVFLFNDLNTLEDARMNWLDDQFDEDEPLAHLEITPHLSHEIKPDPDMPSHSQAFKKISPSHIKIVYRDDQPNRPFGKSEEETFEQLRKFMFAEAPLQKSEPSDIYVVYDVNNQEIYFMKKEEIIDGLKNKTLNKYALARDLACNINATCIAHIPDFEDIT